MKEFEIEITAYIGRLKELQSLYFNTQGWVVESNNHINVGAENGINGTDFSVKSIGSCDRPSIWDTKEEATLKGADYYLIDGAGKPICMKITKAYDFFTKEIENAKELLLLVENKIDHQ